MTVRFRPFTWIGAASGAPVTQWADSFNRADTANGLGADYIGSSRNPLQSSVAAVPSVRIVSGQMVAFCNGAGLGSQTPGTVVFPVQLLNSAVYGKSQFAELTYQSSGGGGNVDCSPGAMFTGDFSANTQNGYLLNFEVGGTLRLLLFDTSTHVLTSVAYVPAAGDVIRLEAVPGAASNVLTAKVNGAVKFTYTDNTGPIRTGYPVLWPFANVPVHTRNFSRFAAGIL